ncbi:MAG: hypothetical protein ACRDA5_12735 [Clostridium sp.]
MKWFMFIWDFIGYIKEIWEILMDRDEKILSKIIYTTITIAFIFLSAKIWL